MPSWSEFSWSKQVEGAFTEICPDGFKEINNLWLGTVEGNHTDNKIYPTDDRWRGQLPPVRPVNQSIIANDYPVRLCGKRSKHYNYVNATRVEMTVGSGTFECPSGLQPCSQNTTLAGSTICVEDTSTCPVTDIAIINVDDSESSYMSNDNYVK